MLAKKNRLDKKGVDLVFKLCPPSGNRGFLLFSTHLTFKFLKEEQNTDPRISFIASKGVVKLAVKRNLLRRSGYSALAKHIQTLPSCISGVFIFKKYQDDVSILENEIKTILHKVN
ncbi:MAG: ribonuclease P protein component [Patescibacteria group bacterium]